MSRASFWITASGASTESFSASATIWRTFTAWSRASVSDHLVAERADALALFAGELRHHAP